jgi:hypothetical protein
MSAESIYGRSSEVALLAADNGPQSTEAPAGGSQAPALAPDSGMTLPNAPPGNCSYAYIGHPPELVLVCKVPLAPQEPRGHVPLLLAETPIVSQAQFIFGLGAAFIAGIVVALVVARLSRR